MTRLLYFSNGRWEIEGSDAKHAKSLIPNGCDDRTFKLSLKAAKEQGMPTVNRATRRQSKRVGDKARRAKAKREE